MCFLLMLSIGVYLSVVDVNGIFRVMRREGQKNPELMLQQLDLFVQQSIELQTQRQLKHQKSSVSGTKAVSSNPQAVLQHVNN